MNLKLTLMVILLITVSIGMVSACDGQYGNYVQIQVVDNNNRQIQNGLIVADPFLEGETAEWLSLFVETTNLDKIPSSSCITNDQGKCNLILYPIVKYHINIQWNDKIKLLWLFPSDNNYVVVI